MSATFIYCMVIHSYKILLGNCTFFKGADLNSTVPVC